MIAPNTIEQIRKAVCESVSIQEVAQETFSVDLPLELPDSDPCRIYVGKTGEGWRVFDDGNSVQRASYEAEVNVLGTGYIDRFRQITEFFSVEESMGELSIRSIDNLGEAVFRMTQVAIEIVNLARSPKDRESSQRRNAFAEKLSSVITRAIPESNYIRNWTNPETDVDKLYPVDYRIENTKSFPVCIFGAATARQCMHSTMSYLFHKSSNSKFHSIAILGNPDRLPRGEKQRLVNAVEITFDITTQTDEIISHIASLAA